MGYELRTLRLGDSLDLVDGVGIARESVVNLLDVFLSNQRALCYCGVGGFSVSLSLRCPIGQKGKKYFRGLIKLLCKCLYRVSDREPDLLGQLFDLRGDLALLLLSRWHHLVQLLMNAG